MAYRILPSEYEGHKVRSVPRGLLVSSTCAGHRAKGGHQPGHRSCAAHTGGDQLKLERRVEHGASCATQTLYSGLNKYANTSAPKPLEHCVEQVASTTTNLPLPGKHGHGSHGTALPLSRPRCWLRQQLLSRTARCPVLSTSRRVGESTTAGARSSGHGRRDGRTGVRHCPHSGAFGIQFPQYFGPNGKALAVHWLSPLGLSPLQYTCTQQSSAQLGLNFSSARLVPLTIVVLFSKKKKKTFVVLCFFSSNFKIEHLILYPPLLPWPS